MVALMIFMVLSALAEGIREYPSWTFWGVSVPVSVGKWLSGLAVASILLGGLPGLALLMVAVVNARLRTPEPE